MSNYSHNYSQNIKELKLKYNYFIKRVEKAENFFKKCKTEDIDKFMPEFFKIIKDINNTGNKIEKLIGRALTSEEVLEGFKEN